MKISNTLWVEKYRPTSLDTYLGNEDFIRDLQVWITNGDFPNLMFHGGPGIGKTTAAKLLVNNIECEFRYLNCSDTNGIGTIRDEVKSFASSASFVLKVIILDESDFLTPEAQAALRNIIETYSGNTRFIFTCNFINKIIEPLQSRLCLYELSSPSMEEVAMFCKNILDAEKIQYKLSDIADIVKKVHPDIRKIVNLLQSCSSTKTLIIDKRAFDLSEVSITVANLVKNGKKQDKVFNNVRQIIADNNVKDFTELYRTLYNSLPDAHSTVVIAEYLQKSVTAPDKEICFMACVAKLTNLN